MRKSITIIHGFCCVLLANLKLANAINIPESILLAEGGDTFQSGDLSRALFSQIAQEIGDGSGVADIQAIIDRLTCGL